jgi:hypothetical protein
MDTTEEIPTPSTDCPLRQDWWITKPWRRDGPTCIRVSAGSLDRPPPARTAGRQYS